MAVARWRLAFRIARGAAVGRVKQLPTAQLCCSNGADAAGGVTLVKIALPNFGVAPTNAVGQPATHTGARVLDALARPLISRPVRRAGRGASRGAPALWLL